MLVRSIFILCCLGTPLFGQGINQEQKDLFKDYYRMRAARIRFALDEQRPLTMRAKPVLAWASQEGDNFLSGDVFVWEHEGVPGVIGCIGSLGSTESRGVFQEYHCLTREPILPTKMEVVPGGNRRVIKTWKPPTLELKPLKTKESPNERPRIRALQMGQLAKSFTVHMRHRGNESQLRMMPKPIHRYEAKAEGNSEVVDGAIYAFVWKTFGTDPEFLLLVECQRHDDKLSWHFAPVRIGYRPLRMDRNGAEVWSNDGRGLTLDNNAIYFTTGGGKLTADEMKKEIRANAKRAS